MNINQIIGGYIVAEYEGEGAERRVFVTLEGVFEYMLLHFEGRCPKFNNPLLDFFGEVIINRTIPEVSLSRTFVGENTNDRNK